MDKQTQTAPRVRAGSDAPARATSLPGPLPVLETLNDVARSLSFVEGRSSPLDGAVAGTFALLNADGVAVLDREKRGEYLFRNAEGILSEWQGFTLAGESARMLDVLLERDRIVLFKRKQHTPWAREFLFAAGMSWGALAPIRVRDEFVGALLVNQAAAPNVRAEHVAALQNLATLAGVAILESRKQAKLEEVFMGVIVSLTMALEAKDPYTEGHSVRVAAYSEAIGKQLGLPPAMCGHNSYWLWGPGRADGSVIIIVGGDLEDHQSDFERVEQAGVVHCRYCMPYERDLRVYVGHGLKTPLAQIWPRVRFYI